MSHFQDRNLQPLRHSSLFFLLCFFRHPHAFRIKDLVCKAMSLKSLILIGGLKGGAEFSRRGVFSAKHCFAKKRLWFSKYFSRGFYPLCFAFKIEETESLVQSYALQSRGDKILLKRILTFALLSKSSSLQSRALH